VQCREQFREHFVVQWSMQIEVKVQVGRRIQLTEHSPTQFATQ
jgi:hypothetical protein